MFNLQGCSREDFKAVNTLVASISLDNDFGTNPYMKGFDTCSQACVYYLYDLFGDQSLDIMEFTV